MTSQSRDRQDPDWSHGIDWLEEFRSSLSRTCADAIYSHVFGRPDREVGGVLVGMKSPIGNLPMVEAAIGAMKADEQRATLTFTQGSWEHVHRVMDTRFPDSQIVGWYHSHPGFGIFLSEEDLFIHHNFFSDPSQVALVVDPVAGIEGLFSWRGNRVVQRYQQNTPMGWGPVTLRELEAYDPEGEGT